MTKRRLSHQQNLRIAKQQELRRDMAKSNSENTNGPAKTAEEQPGLVIARYGKQADIEAADRTVWRCHLRTNLGDIVTGDRVVWCQHDDESGVVVSIEPSTNRLQRPDSYGKLKAVAANIDQVFITIAAQPIPHAGLIDRYLVAAENLGVTPVLLVNKIDLVNDTSKLYTLLDSYRALNYPVLEISVKTHLGLAPLKDLLRDKTNIFAGQSGVGKSSVIQALLPEESIKIGELSEQVAKGKHTTTHSRLYHFPDGGTCIDSPGIREFGLWHFNAESILYGFIELRDLAGHCKFRDCSHQHEPGCAIIEAAHNKHISEQRFESFRRIINSLDDVDIKPSL